MNETTDFIAVAITEAFGERCPEYAEGCPACDAWKRYDDLAALSKEVQASEAVAWRWTWKSATEDDGWAYTETAPTGFDGQRVIEPLFATPQPLPATDSVTEAATALVHFAWSAVVTDCTESAEYLNELVDNLTAALTAALSVPAPGTGEDKPEINGEYIQALVEICELFGVPFKVSGTDNPADIVEWIAANVTPSTPVGEGKQP